MILLSNLDLSKMTEAEIAEAKAIEARAKELEKATSGHREHGALGLKIIASNCYSLRFVPHVHRFCLACTLHSGRDQSTSVLLF